MQHCVAYCVSCMSQLWFDCKHHFHNGKIPDKNGKLRKRSKNLFVADGAFYWRANSGHLRGAAGRPVMVNSPGCADVLGVVRGVSVGLEIKTEAGRQSPEQKAWQVIFEAAGGVYAVVRSVGEARAVVEAILSKKAQAA